MSMIMSCLFSILLEPYQPMEDILSFNKVMGVYASNIEQMEVFPTIKEEDTEVGEQVSGGHEATTSIKVDGGHPICATRSSG